MPAVSVRLLDLGLVLNIHLGILDYQLSSSFGLCFLYRRWGINLVKIAFELLWTEMGSYKNRKQSPVFFLMVANVKVTQQFYDICYVQCSICVH